MAAAELGGPHQHPEGASLHWGAPESPCPTQHDHHLGLHPQGEEMLPGMSTALGPCSGPLLIPHGAYGW